MDTISVACHAEAVVESTPAIQSEMADAMLLHNVSLNEIQQALELRKNQHSVPSCHVSRLSLTLHLCTCKPITGLVLCLKKGACTWQGQSGDFCAICAFWCMREAMAVSVVVSDRSNTGHVGPPLRRRRHVLCPEH